MLNRILLTCASLVLTSGAALADADGDLSNPSTTGTEEMEQPSSAIGEVELNNRRDGMNDLPDGADREAGLGAMGAGASGTTDGTGASTSNDLATHPDAEADQ